MLFMIYCTSSAGLMVIMPQRKLPKTSQKRAASGSTEVPLAFS